MVAFPVARFSGEPAGSCSPAGPVSPIRSPHGPSDLCDSRIPARRVALCLHHGSCSTAPALVAFPAVQPLCASMPCRSTEWQLDYRPRSAKIIASMRAGRPCGKADYRTRLHIEGYDPGGYINRSLNEDLSLRAGKAVGTRGWVKVYCLLEIHGLR